MPDDMLELFLVCAPGLEPMLAEEARALGLTVSGYEAGGVTARGGWPDVWRANLGLRCATRVLVRVGGFPVHHLAQLDKRARKFDWRAVLRPDVPVRVEASCRASKIYHDRAAAQRVETALRESLGVPVSKDAALRLMVRIEDNYCTFSLDSSGAPLHKRGHKPFVGKAAMRETMAAAFLRQMGYDGSEPLVDPMCGSGTFVLEAAEIAAGLMPGRSRAFAFEELGGHDADAVAALRVTRAPATPRVIAHGFDRDAGAIRGASENAARAGLTHWTHFARQPISDLVPPEGPAGLVMVNPPYGARIGNRKLLFGLYATLGKVLSERFAGWRVGIVTSDGGLAKATGLPLQAGPPVAHGGLKVKLYRTDPG